MRRLDLIVQTAPDWAIIVGNGHAITLLARPLRGSGKPTRGYELLIEQKTDGTITVREAKPSFLPIGCPTRHINSDGTFCIAFKAGLFDDTIQASRWWDRLKSFLTLQETAADTKIWPSYAGLAHGYDAALLQLELEATCTEIGNQTDLDQALQKRKGPLVTASKIRRTKAGHLINGRSECPCGRTSKNGRKLLRRECKKRQLECPAKLLAQLRLAETDFWKSYRGRKCCGTMLDCELRKINEASQ